MFQGTGSDVGKSLLVAGLARLFHNRGLRVRPFKPQNMSNNAAVTADGGEIGRAQALQARAAGVPTSVHMNPVLLKPQSEIGAQVVVQGRVVGNAKAAEYQQHEAATAWAPVLDSFARLCAEADIVLVEGAGSASEVNLRAGRHRQHGLCPRCRRARRAHRRHRARRRHRQSRRHAMRSCRRTTRAMIEGFIVNKFRGDPTLFADGLARGARDDRLARVRPRAVLRRRRSTAGRGCARLGRGAGGKAGSQGAHRRAGVSARRPISTISMRCALEPGVDLKFLRPGRADSRECRPRHPAGLEGDDRRSRRAARGAMGRRSQSARAAGRTRARHLRRLSDAGQAGRRSARDRRAAIDLRRPRTARCRDRADGRQAVAGGHGGQQG